MNRKTFFPLAGATVFGYIAGAATWNLGMMTSFAVSGVGSLVGVWAGWKFGRWLENR